MAKPELTPVDLEICRVCEKPKREHEFSVYYKSAEREVGDWVCKQRPNMPTEHIWYQQMSIVELCEWIERQHEKV